MCVVCSFIEVQGAIWGILCLCELDVICPEFNQNPSSNHTHILLALWLIKLSLGIHASTSQSINLHLEFWTGFAGWNYSFINSGYPFGIQFFGVLLKYQMLSVMHMLALIRTHG